MKAQDDSFFLGTAIGKKLSGVLDVAEGADDFLIIFIRYFIWLSNFSQMYRDNERGTEREEE